MLVKSLVLKRLFLYQTQKVLSCYNRSDFFDKIGHGVK